MHYPKAVEALKADSDGRAVVAKMKEMPTDDRLFGKGLVRADGRKVHNAYVFEVKKPGEAKISRRLLQIARDHSGSRGVPPVQGWRLPMSADE